MSLPIKLSEEESRFIEVHSRAIHAGDGNWMYIPIWWKKIGDNLWEYYTFETLPDHVKDAIKKTREGE